MVEEARLAPAVEAFRAQIFELQAARATLSAEEIERAVDRALETFCADCRLPLRCRARFEDVVRLIGARTHTQLACVVWRGDGAHLIFPAALLDPKDANGLVFVAKAWVLLVVMARLRREGPLPEADFMFEIGDNAYLDAVAFCSKNPQACLIMDDEFAASLGYRPFRSLCAAQPLAWEERRPRLVWRGSTTGLRGRPPPADAKDDDLSWLPRLQMCRLAADPAIAGFCDVGVTSIVQVDEADLAERIRASGLLRPPMPREEMRRYRYILDVDGNSNAWSGLFCALLGGGCVLKVASRDGYRQWYYDEMRPFEHFVPIASDLRDFVEVASSAMAGGAAFEEIARRGRELAESITFEDALTAGARAVGAWLERRTRSGAPMGRFLAPA